MRMKLKKPGQLLLVALAGVGVASLLSACSQLTGTLTVDFVYVTSARAAGPNSYGEVDVFEVNSESGKMRQIPTSPFPSGGRNPVAEAVSTDHNYLYVVNRDDNTIVQFALGNDGKVYPQQTVNTPGIFPLATAVAGTTLFVADTYQPLPICSPASPCTGSVAAFPIATAVTSIGGATFQKGGLETGLPLNSCNGLNYLPLALSGSAASHIVNPTAIASISSGSNLFVTATDTNANVGYVFGFTIGTTSCQIGGATVSIPTLTPISGSPWVAGIKPSAVTQDPTGSYLYVTDADNNNVLAWSVTSGGLTPLNGSPFTAGNSPSAIVIDSTGKFAYVANALDSNVTAYTISGGALTHTATFATDLQPVAIGIDPSLNQYLYTVNFLSNTLSGFQLNSTTGALLNSQNSPYGANANPTAVVAIPHGKKK